LGGGCCGGAVLILLFSAESRARKMLPPGGLVFNACPRSKTRPPHDTALSFFARAPPSRPLPTAVKRQTAPPREIVEGWQKGLAYAIVWSGGKRPRENASWWAGAPPFAGKLDRRGWGRPPQVFDPGSRGNSPPGGPGGGGGKRPRASCRAREGREGGGGAAQDRARINRWSPFLKRWTSPRENSLPRPFPDARAGTNSTAPPRPRKALFGPCGPAEKLPRPPPVAGAFFGGQNSNRSPAALKKKSRLPDPQRSGPERPQAPSPPPGFFFFPKHQCLAPLFPPFGRPHKCRNAAPLNSECAPPLRADPKRPRGHLFRQFLPTMGVRPGAPPQPPPPPGRKRGRRPTPGRGGGAPAGEAPAPFRGNPPPLENARGPGVPPISPCVI